MIVRFVGKAGLGKMCLSGVVSAVLSCAAVVAEGTDGSAVGDDSLSLADRLNAVFVRAAESVSASVVVIEVAHRRPSRLATEQSPSADESAPGEDVFDAGGSGVVVSRGGYVLTNFHVIEGASRLRVRLRDGQSFPASVRGQDPQSDIAVIQIEAGERRRVFQPAVFGDSDKVRVGEFAIAVGAPFDLDYSVTFGHVSAKGRSGGVLGSAGADQDFIQTDADINPGNSGGPLVNIRGEIIGVNTLVRGMNTGIGFAIPINMALEIADQIMEHGKFTRARLGIEIETLADVDDFNQLLKEVDQGIVVRGMNPNGPAADSDLQPADVIVAVEGVSVATVQELKNQVRSKPIGDPLNLSVVRMGRRQETRRLEIEVIPEEWLAETVVSVPSRKHHRESKAPTSGLRLRAIDDDWAKLYGLKTREGVVLTEIERNTPASRSTRLRPGVVVTAVNLIPVRSPWDVAEAWESVDLRKGVVIHFVDSNGTPMFEFLKDRGD